MSKAPTKSYGYTNKKYAPYTNSPYKPAAKNTLPKMSTPDIERILTRLDKLVREVEQISESILAVLPECMLINLLFKCTHLYSLNIDEEGESEEPSTQPMDGDEGDADLVQALEEAEERAAVAKGSGITRKKK